jgi:hypothetical protein
MGRIRKIAASPKCWLMFHAANSAKWIILFPVGMAVWRQSVPFLMYVSLDTALTGALVGCAAALAARKADPDDPL